MSGKIYAYAIVMLLMSWFRNVKATVYTFSHFLPFYGIESYLAYHNTRFTMTMMKLYIWSSLQLAVVVCALISSPKVILAHMDVARFPSEFMMLIPKIPMATHHL